ncbi:PadR family transcriptional regulator [Amycolatopsis jiangsuensis]|uniref:DNA-binding PadR family transcriptional regulator n=1 Tax=Amycolatopsis jiangsuensis TaxID=1181879 RepID=A0A840IP38_9PSEU|nr:PadR family transcriptional regulator [Amycolatopsis jiangsuensis]MBB4682834.1 DNA-binding PadR family transcriptional regulator [Amycolatopsis jiangsuensis]
MTLRHAVLGLLAEAPGSGYDLLKRFETAMANVWSATQSQLYGELGKLEKSGLIEVVSEGPRGRKEYAITGEGRAELRAWLLEPWAPPSPRSETLLRIYFLGEVAPVQAREYVRRYAESADELAGHLASIDESVDWDDSDSAVFGRLVLEWGKRHAAMEREWADWAVERIRTARG